MDGKFGQTILFSYKAHLLNTKSRMICSYLEKSAQAGTYIVLLFYNQKSCYKLCLYFSCEGIKYHLFWCWTDATDSTCLVKIPCVAVPFSVVRSVCWDNSMLVSSSNGTVCTCILLNNLVASKVIVFDVVM
jgi:hypothetical protein